MIVIVRHGEYSDTWINAYDVPTEDVASFVVCADIVGWVVAICERAMLAEDALPPTHLGEVSCLAIKGAGRPFVHMTEYTAWPAITPDVAAYALRTFDLSKFGPQREALEDRAAGNLDARGEPLPRWRREK